MLRARERSEGGDYKQREREREAEWEEGDTGSAVWGGRLRRLNSRSGSLRFVSVVCIETVGGGDWLQG